MQKVKILCIGEPLQESVAEKHADGQLHNQRSTGFAGDMAPNFAAYARMAANTLNVPCDIDVLTALGGQDDEPSNAAVYDMQQRGLGIHPATKRFEGKTMGSVINLKDAEGNPHPEKVQMDRQDSAFRDLLKDTDDSTLRTMVGGYTHIVVSGIPLACVREREKLVKLLQFAKEQEPPTKIIVSTNLRPANWKMSDQVDPQGLTDQAMAMAKAKRWLDKIIPLADMIFANATDEKNVRNSQNSKDAVTQLRTLNHEADIIVTDDADPIIIDYHDAAGNQQTTLPIATPSTIVDTTGAGDSLAATTLIGKLSRMNLRQSVEMGSLIASQVVGFNGALPEFGKALQYQEPNAPAAAILRTC